MRSVEEEMSMMRNTLAVAVVGLTALLAGAWGARTLRV